MRTGRQGQPCSVPHNVGPTAVSLASQRVACRRAIALPRTRQPRPGRSRGLSVTAQKNSSATVNEKGIVVELLPMAPCPCIQPLSIRPPLLCSALHSELHCFAADRHRGRDAVQQDPVRQSRRDRSAGLPRRNRVRRNSKSSSIPGARAAASSTWKGARQPAVRR